jgi:hypothetical protein
MYPMYDMRQDKELSLKLRLRRGENIDLEKLTLNEY